ncbi:ATM interactor-like [Montipora capricornis]|uniref:ATM interactor-like n=1 Tax=Montipora capricornis TaxID=246305 RepID=UPI0035F1F7D4
MATSVEEICPSVETLIQKESGVSFSCPIQGCSRVFQNRPCLKMHLVKSHGVAVNEEEKNLYVRGTSKSTVEKHFYCPVKHCVRGQGTNRPFPRMSQLKQHYMTVHAEKKNICSKCGKGFGLADACRRHELKCGQLFTCSCGCPYTTLEALLTHAKRKMHKFPECYKSKKERSSSKTPVQPAVAFVVVMPSPSDAKPGQIESTKGKKDKQCQPSQKHRLILPKLDPSTGFVVNTAPRRGTKSVQTQTLSLVHSMHTQTPRHQTSLDQGHDSFTQTLPTCTPASQQFPLSNGGSGNFQICFNQSSVGTQVALLASQCDFGVGTDDSFLAQLSGFNSDTTTQPFGFQANMPQAVQAQQFLPLSSFVQRQDKSSFVSTNDNSMQTLAGDQTQTKLINTCDLRALSSTQTQTSQLEQVPLEDNETQTLISLLGIDSVSSMDSGTQTQNFLDDLFDAQDIELTESQTQTWFPSYHVTSPGLDNGVDDFVYKTFDDLVDMHTQTSIVMSDFSELTEDIVLANSHTQTLQSDFVDSSILSSSVQTDIHWDQMTLTNRQIRSDSVTSTSCQTQT